MFTYDVHGEVLTPTAVSESIEADSPAEASAIFTARQHGRGLNVRVLKAVRRVPRMRAACMECDFRGAVRSFDPECPLCHSSDLEMDDAA